MADPEVEAEWEKSKQIEAERMKAVQAMSEAKPDVGALAELGPQMEKARGWSNDSKLVMAKAEKLGTWSAILAPVGIVMMIISDVGNVVVQVGRLGMFGIMFGIFAGLGMICLAGAIFFGVIGLITALYYRFKNGQKLGVAGWSGMVAISLVVVYWLVRSLIMGM